MNTNNSHLFNRRHGLWAAAALALAGVFAAGAQSSNSTVAIKRDATPSP
jgi:hypothetical protein